jgi:hypothetical protein
MKNKKNYSKNVVQKNSYKFRFSKYVQLGTPDAETDNNLERVFIDTGACDVLCDITNPKCIIVGRTGSGKSALIRRIVENSNKCRRIAPESMSLKFLSNSTILDYFRKLGIGLNFFYKVLWKHVFIVEILKLYIGETDERKSTILQRLWANIKTGNKSDEIKKKAIEYFEKWSDEFWMKTEHRIKSLENDLESKFYSEAGFDINALKAAVKGEQIFSEKNTSEIKYKAEQIINQIQADDLVNLIEILSAEVFNNTQRKYFIVIDDLDKDWVSPQIVYDLIGAMIEVIKEFQEKFKGVKIVIALRDNLHQLIFSGKEHRGGQREKFAPLFLNLTWSTNELKELIDSRIKLLTDEQLNILSIFDKSSKFGQSSFDYMIERTYNRPRDIISFFNKVIEQANNKTHFTPNLIKQAEPSYSMERLHALEDEWAENFGDISKCYTFLFGIHNGFNVYNIKEDSFADVLLDNELLYSVKGELKGIIEKWRSSGTNLNDFKEFLKELLFIFFRIGIIGIKRKPELPIEYFYNYDASIDSSDFNQNVKIYVHKALFSALKINSKEQEIDFLSS